MDKNLLFVCDYLRKTERLKTLEVLEADLPKKRTLSFAILKPPPRKKIKLENDESQSTKRKKPKIKKDEEKTQKPEIPAKFKMIAKKFGLPKEHLDFFYEHRKNFHWETMCEKKISCIMTGCDFSAPVKLNSLVDHMIEVHDYGQYACDQSSSSCNFVAYSMTCLRKHKTIFHGNGNRRVLKNTPHHCKYCKYSAPYEHLLEFHIRIHENRLLKCQYCNYTAVHADRIHEHMLHHFNVRNFHCETCGRSFLAKSYLKHHMRIHMKDYNCSSCSKPFESRHLHDQHVKNCKDRLNNLKDCI